MGQWVAHDIYKQKQYIICKAAELTKLLYSCVVTSAVVATSVFL